MLNGMLKLFFDVKSPAELPHDLHILKARLRFGEEIGCIERYGAFAADRGAPKVIVLKMIVDSAERKRFLVTLDYVVEEDALVINRVHMDFVPQHASSMLISEIPPELSCQ
jgi:hypothetical protein